MRSDYRKRLEAKLGPRKVKAALMLVEMELVKEGYGDDGENVPKKYEDIAAEIGVTPKSLWQWRTQDKNFINYKNGIADDFLEEKRTQVYNRLMSLINTSQPSVKAIDLYFKRFGLLSERQVNVEVSADGKSNEDIDRSLKEIDEILNEEEIYEDVDVDIEQDIDEALEEEEK